MEGIPDELDPGSGPPGRGILAHQPAGDVGTASSIHALPPQHVAPRRHANTPEQVIGLLNAFVTRLDQAINRTTTQLVVVDPELPSWYRSLLRHQFLATGSETDTSAPPRPTRGLGFELVLGHATMSASLAPAALAHAAHALVGSGSRRSLPVLEPGEIPSLLLQSLAHNRPHASLTDIVDSEFLLSRGLDQRFSKFALISVSPNSVLWRIGRRKSTARVVASWIVINTQGEFDAAQSVVFGAD